ncbi:hypothetical protein Tco_0680409 [Tanacetum coccineum]|uniref:Uncharacterized protein n=1 Tax=Tanacetum coccineum TaxID=301880 RepID=A0ABQ4XLX2_9ASTR
MKLSIKKLGILKKNIKFRGGLLGLKDFLMILELLLLRLEQIRLDEELTFKLQAEEEKEEWLAREKQRRKHFAAKRAEEKRNNPPTQAQQRKIMCTYLKNMEGKKPKDLKNKSFDSIQKMFNKAFKRLEQESMKKQKVDEDRRGIRSIEVGFNKRYPTTRKTGQNTKVSVSNIESSVLDDPHTHISNQASKSSHPAPRDRWSRDKHIELVNIIGDPSESMLTRSMAAKLTAASASECLFADFLSKIEPKKVYEALKYPRWVDAVQEELN